MTAIESRIAGGWWAKQSAKGVPATTADKRGRIVAGDMAVNREDGNENYADGQRFPSAADFVNSLSGSGNPAFQGQPGVVGHLVYLMSGQETVSALGIAAGAPFEHVSTPNNAGSFWATFWKLVGQTVGPLKQKFNDCRLTSLRIEGSTGAKVLRITPTFVSLDAGEVFTTDPIKVDDGVEPNLFTDAEGAFKVDGTVFRAHSSFAFVITDTATPWAGDSVVPVDVVFGAGTVAIENITILVNEQGYAFYCRQIYGREDPPAGTRPIKQVPELGSWEATFGRGQFGTLATTGAPTGGSSVLTIDGVDTTIPFDATAAAVKTALEAEGIDVESTSGGPLPGAAIQIRLLRGGRTITVDDSGLTGGTSPETTWTEGGPTAMVKIELLGVRWAPDLSIAPNPDGGAVEFTLGAQARKNGANPMYRVTTRSEDPAYT